METIKQYLETMFASLPDTPEVRRAKEELLQMMEDKYNELLAEGMVQNLEFHSNHAAFWKLPLPFL